MRIGPLAVAELKLDVVYVDKLDMSHAIDMSSTIRMDSQKLDIIGHIVPAPLIVPSSTVLEINAASNISGVSGPYELSETTRPLRLNNNTGYDMPYKIETLACRRPGLKLIIPKRLNSSLNTKKSEYDTIDVVIDQSSGTIPANSFVEVNISFIAGHTAGMDICLQESSKLNPSILASVPVTIINKRFPLHPPAVVELMIVGDVALPFMRTRPVTELKRQRQERDSQKPKPLDFVEDNERNAAANKYANIRIRGVTYNSSKDAYDIGLGVHTQKNEFVEWLLKIENGSERDTFCYKVYTTNPLEDNEWMVLGHSFGIIPSNTFSSVMLYFSRRNVGVFHTNVIIENASSDEILYSVSVSIEIVPDDSLCNSHLIK